MATYDITKIALPSGDIANLKDANATKTEASTTNGNIKIDGVETQVYDDSDIQDKIDETTTSISGNPISIPNLKANQLAVNPTITLEPIQAGSGTPSPSNIRAISGYDTIEVISCGVNVWDEVWEQGEYNNSGAKATGNGVRSVNKISIRPNTTYYLKSTADLWICQYGIDGAFISRANKGKNVSFTTGTNTYYITFNTASAYGDTYNNDISINYPAAQTSYVASVKTTSISEPLGQTVYGGTLDVRTGVLTVDRQIVVVDGSESWTISGVSAYLEIATMKQGLNMSGVCSKLMTGGSAGQLQLGNNNKRIYLVSIATYGLSNASDVQTFMTDVQLVYPLATPIEIQLTPHEISLLKDYAYVSTNGTNIALDYHNGELASLADVSQLGETVNNLNNNVTNGELTDLVKQGTYGIFYYELKKSGRLVELYLELYNVRYTTLTRIANVPTGFIPAHSKTANIIAADAGTGLIQKGFMRVNVTNTGEIQAAFMGSTSENIFAHVTLMYYV